jgi:hypothetical protein
MGTKATVFERNPAEEVGDLLFPPEAEKLLRQVDGRKSLVELTNTPPLTAVQNARLLYGFFALHLIAVKAPIKIQVKTAGVRHGGSQS